MRDRPNLLVIMSDEHAPQFSGFGGHAMAASPNLDRLAADGATFDAAYCNSPLCVPSRMSFMTGRMPSSIEVYDNASPMPSQRATWAHMVRAAGYDAVLAGKQHFVGPDRLHGFRQQLARDLHATALHPLALWDDGLRPAERLWSHLEHSGPGSTPELESDDEVESVCLDYIHSRAGDDRPWALNASFIAPHFPFIAPEQYWDRYAPEDVDLPDLPEGHLDGEHPVYSRLRQVFGLEHVTEDQLRRARAGYYALVTYLDDKVGRLLEALEATGQAEDTVVVYTSDHGELLGEHGLWRKSTFHEHSARVPLIIRWPGVIPEGRRVHTPVSLVDIAPTLAEIAGCPVPIPLDGTSLVATAMGTETGTDEGGRIVVSEYLAHGVTGPGAMLRRGDLKLITYLGHEPQLFDVVADPGEFDDLARDPDHAAVLSAMQAELDGRFDAVDLDRRVRADQRERRLIRTGHGIDESTASSAGALTWGDADGVVW
jgi:choline-sulfatase